MQLSFHEWNGTPPDHRIAHSLNESDVQVWTSVLPQTGGDFSAWHSLLSEDESRRADRFRVEEPRQQYIFARATLRQILAAGLDTTPEAIRFAYEPKGKPVLNQPGLNVTLHFNLSHTGRHIAIALSRRRRVGIDIESACCPDDWLEVARKIFSGDELHFLENLSASQRAAAFFKGWVGKEAYLKATGEGLIDNLPAIQVSIAPETPHQLIALPEGPTALHRWKIGEVPLPPGLAGAVVWEAEPLPRKPIDRVP